MDMMVHSLIEPLTWQPCKEGDKEEYWGVGKVEF